MLHARLTIEVSFQYFRKGHAPMFSPRARKRYNLQIRVFNCFHGGFYDAAKFWMRLNFVLDFSAPSVEVKSSFTGRFCVLFQAPREYLEFALVVEFKLTRFWVAFTVFRFCFVSH